MPRKCQPLNLTQIQSTNFRPSSKKEGDGLLSTTAILSIRYLSFSADDNIFQNFHDVELKYNHQKGLRFTILQVYFISFSFS